MSEWSNGHIISPSHPQTFKLWTFFLLPISILFFLLLLPEFKLRESSSVTNEHKETLTCPIFLQYKQ